MIGNEKRFVERSEEKELPLIPKHSVMEKGRKKSFHVWLHEKLY